MALEEPAVCWAWPPSPWVLTVMAYSRVAGLKSTGTVCLPAEVVKVNSAFLNSLERIMATGRAGVSGGELEALVDEVELLDGEFGALGVEVG